MTSAESTNPDRTGSGYYPWWLDNLADDVTGEGAAMQGTVRGAVNVHKVAGGRNQGPPVFCP